MTYDRKASFLDGIATVLLTALFLLTVRPLMAQEAATFTGVVMSSSLHTLTIRTTEGKYQLFVIERTTKKPSKISPGAQVRVISFGEDGGARTASEIIELQAASSTSGGSPESGTVVPTDVRRVESDIERQARRFRFGVRAGVALDPELVVIGIQSQVGPFFNKDIYFRPNVEFAYGEVTALFALNPEVVYRLPLSSRTAQWSTYFGIGPGFNFVHQSFENTSGTNRIDFGQFHSDVGLNILGGVQYRSGMFVELKTSVYARPSPTLRLMVGYSF